MTPATRYMHGDAVVMHSTEATVVGENCNVYNAFQRNSFVSRVEFGGGTKSVIIVWPPNSRPDDSTVALAVHLAKGSKDGGVVVVPE